MGMKYTICLVIYCRICVGTRIPSMIPTPYSSFLSSNPKLLDLQLCLHPLSQVARFTPNIWILAYPSHGKASKRKILEESN